MNEPPCSRGEQRRPSTLRNRLNYSGHYAPANRRPIGQTTGRAFNVFRWHSLALLAVPFIHPLSRQSTDASFDSRSRLSNCYPMNCTHSRAHEERDALLPTLLSPLLPACPSLPLAASTLAWWEHVSSSSRPCPSCSHFHLSLISIFPLAPVCVRTRDLTCTEYTHTQGLLQLARLGWHRVRVRGEHWQ